MLEIIPSNLKINFAAKFSLCGSISALTVLASIFLALFHLKYGVDFRGGAEIQIKFDSNVSMDNLRSSLERQGFTGTSLQTIGEATENEYLVKIQAAEQDLNKLSNDIGAALQKDFQSQGPQIRKVDIVGPKAGAQLRIAGIQAMFWAMLAIMIYVGLRFDFKYSPGAIVALFHDVLIVVGVYALVGTEFTLQTVAALLAVIGYSVNDTVIIYDRVREHEMKFVGLSLKEHLNSAINDTLSRTILTSGTTMFVSLSMLLFGGPAIRDFFLAISIGIFVGTYSSIFIAAPVTLLMERWKKA